MDIPRIGYGAVYRPPQAGVGRTGEGVPEDRVLNAKAPDPRAAESKSPGKGRAPGEPLSDEQQKQVDKLKAIDTKVRQHEAAHQAAGGGLVGGASYTYTEGPDGRRYATGGEVPISAPSASSPEAAIRQAEQIKRAALAPADPSGQDLAVAAAATAQQAQAQRQLAAARQAEANGEGQDKGQAGEQAGATGAAPPAGERRPAPVGAEDGPERPPAAGATPGTPDAPQSNAAAIPALVARGVAAYGAAARVNAAPQYATALFA